LNSIGRIEHEPCAARRRFAIDRSVGHLVAAQVHLDPGVGVQLLHLIVFAQRIPLAPLEADRHAGGNALAAEHEH
jgi:hypothetical protein